MNAIAKVETGALSVSEPDLINVLSSSLYPGAAPASISMVLSYCRAAGLDPLQKPVHIVPMFDRKAGQMRDVIMPGVGLYRTQASRSNQMAGISEPEFGPMLDEEVGGQRIRYPEWCRVTVRRLMANGQIADFTAVEYWMENYAVAGGKEKSIAPNAMWTKRPRGQLAKCAEAQALRKAFPEIGAAPTAEEMEGKAIETDAAHQHSHVTPPPVEVVEVKTWPEESFNAQFVRWSKAIEAGLKSHEDIVAMARSKGALSAEQEARIRAVVKAAPKNETGEQ